MPVIATTPLVRGTRPLIAAAVAICLSATGCSRGEATEAANEGEAFAEPITITNCDVETTYEEPAQRIISLNDHVTETLIQLGVGDRIIAMGYGDAEPLPELAEEWNKITTTWEEYPSAEEIQDLEPDLVVGGMNSSFEDGREREKLAEMGIDSFKFSEYCGKGFSNIELLEEDFTQLGDILGVPEQAQALTETITEGLDEVRATLEAHDVEPVSAFFYDSGEDQPFTIGGVGIGNLIGEYAGAASITPEGKKPYVESSWETIGERAPESIVVLDYGDTSAADKIEFLKGHPIMATTPAIKNDRIAVLPLANMFESSRMVTAVEALARDLHPEAFAE